MSRLMFVHLSGTEKGKTRIFKQNHVTVGTSDTFDLTIVPEEGGTLHDGLIADLYCQDNEPINLVPRYKQDFLEISINGELPEEDAAAGIELRDGDTIHFGHGLSSASILFQMMPENFSTASLVKQNHRTLEAAQSAQPVHPLTATLFVKELSASLWAEIPKKAKLLGLASFAILTLALLAIIFSNFLILHRNTGQIELLRKQAEETAALRQKDQDHN